VHSAIRHLINFTLRHVISNDRSKLTKWAILVIGITPFIRFITRFSQIQTNIGSTNGPFHCQAWKLASERGSNCKWARLCIFAYRIRSFRGESRDVYLTDSNAPCVAESCFLRVATICSKLLSLKYGKKAMISAFLAATKSAALKVATTMPAALMVLTD
jgi:hypothetical protein